MGKGEHKSPEFLRVNPFGKVPALEETGPEPWSLNESGAILSTSPRSMTGTSRRTRIKELKYCSGFCLRFSGSCDAT